MSSIKAVTGKALKGSHSQKALDAFVAVLHKDRPHADRVSRSDMFDLCARHNLVIPWKLTSPNHRDGRGFYWLVATSSPAPKVVKSVLGDLKRLPPGSTRKSAALAPATVQTVPVATAPIVNEAATLAASGGNPDYVPPTPTPEAVLAPEDTLNLVPNKADGYVPFGNYDDVYSVIKSGRFFPVFLTGLAGCGKTMIPEQACAKLGREYIRVNIIGTTDEDDLLGGFRLVNGATVWHNGPVVVAMERGAVLLLDEVDLGGSKLMCLQPVLEGKPIYLKKINRVVHPAPGFNVIATANTKGRGSMDGKFVGTNVMNEAFLDRFPVMMEQDYPSEAQERKILTKAFEGNGIVVETDVSKFIECLAKWATVVRDTYKQGAISDVISTRRLVDIVNAFMIFRIKMKAINFCLTRFDEENQKAILDLYTKIDAEATIPIGDNPEVPSRISLLVSTDFSVTA